MAYAPHRPSILHRSVRQEAKANVENLDAEFEKEQQRLRFKSERLASTEERLINAFYATENEKRSGWEATQQELQQHSLARQADAEEARQREEAWHAQPQHVSIDTQRPWTAHSTTYYMSREEEDEARRRSHRDAAEQNRRMMQYRSLQQQHERQLEREAIARTVQSEDAWFNRGASSDRWIPPERRIKQRAVVAPQFVPAPPPYCYDAEAPARPGTAPPAPGASGAPAQPPRRNAFWERESGQGAKAALSHDIYFQAEQAQRSRRPATAQARAQCAPSQQGSPARSEASTSTVHSLGQGPARGAAQQPAQRAAAPRQPAPVAQPKYPWSWDT